MQVRAAHVEFFSERVHSRRREGNRRRVAVFAEVRFEGYGGGQEVSHADGAVHMDVRTA